MSGEIPLGLLVYLGVGQADDEREVNYLASKIPDLRIFRDRNGKMNLSLRDLSGGQGEEPGILAISQFTLFADTRKGRRPSYNAAAEPARAARLYEQFVENLRESGVRVETGVFGEHMDVTYINDGPVTIIMDTDDKKRSVSEKQLH